jgi:hypothetical protein
MLRRRRGTVAALACLVGALVAVGYGVEVERDGLAARDAAIAHGVTKQTRVLGSLTNKQRHTRVRFVVDEVERKVSVFPDRAYVEGMTIGVAYLRDDPDRIYIVGATPWSWWTAMRRLFVTVAVVAALVAIGSFVFSAQSRRTSSV